MSRRTNYGRALDALLKAEAQADRARREHRQAPSYATRAALSACLRRLRRTVGVERMVFRALPPGSGAGVWR